MIGSFRDADLEEFYYEGHGRRTRRIPTAIHKGLLRKLDQLFSAVDLRDLRMPPANRLEALKGDRKGRHSIRVSDQWRIVFRWEGDTAYDVELTDYH
jgi:proteic killer suppression protein